MAMITVNNGDNLQTAINDATAGDTLDIRAGTFTGKSTTGWGDVCFKITKQLILQGHTGELPVLTYNPSNVPMLGTGAYGHVAYVSPGLDAVQFINLEIIGMNAINPGSPSQDADDGACIYYDSAGAACTNVLVDSCVLHDHCLGIVYPGPPNTGTIQKNHVYNCGQKAFNPGRMHGIYAGGAPGGMTIAYNHVHSCTGYGLHCYSDAEGVKVYGNLSHHNGIGGLAIYGTGNFVYNNTFADNTMWAAYLESLNTYFRNNICYGSDSAVNSGSPDAVDVRVSAGYSAITGGYNCIGAICTSTDPNYQTQIYHMQTGDLNTDPLFMVSSGRSDWKDYELKPNSPCRGTGIDLASPYDQGLAYS